MGLDPRITLDWADGSYTFALYLSQAMELEEKCGFRDVEGNWRRRPMGQIYADLHAGLAVEDSLTGPVIVAYPEMSRASFLDCREVLRLGLIAGGQGVVNGQQVVVNAPMALKLIEQYVDRAPLKENWVAAFSVIHGGMVGYEPKKKEPVKRRRSSRSTAPRSSRTAA